MTSNTLKPEANNPKRKPALPRKSSRSVDLGRVTSIPKLSITSPCSSCDSSGKTWSCVICEEIFCNDCWAIQAPHKPERALQPGRRVHEKLDEDIVRRQNLIFTELSPEDQRARHESDLETTWLEYTQEGDKSFLDCSDRLLDVIQKGQGEEYAERYPHLVSFVGQTGAGKSTLIRMLIDHQQSQTDGPMDHPTPVSGRINDNIPTTGNVHLYEDPATFSGESPIIYADCEGMSGGENPPLGLGRVSEQSENAGSRIMHQHGRVKLRHEIRWAETPDMQTREYAVTTLFPRIMYSFSDVVVFVLRDARVFQADVLQRLINWAAMSFDKAINQPTLPHIIIVLNATDERIDEQQWNMETATNQLLDDYKSSVRQVPTLRQLCDRLREQGTDIQTTAELLRHYYSSVTVLRVPSRGNFAYKRIEEQVGRLYNIIRTKSAESYSQRRKIRMLLEANKLSLYISAACRHFAGHIDQPFDFSQEARRHMSPPRDLSEHILNFILLMYNNSHAPFANARALLPKLVRPVASAIMLEALRNNTRGEYSKLLRETYEAFLLEAFQAFCDRWLRCSYQKDGQPCFNTKLSHSKNHQSQSGAVLSRGSFESRIQDESFFSAWVNDISQNIDAIDKYLQGLGLDERTSIPQNHQEIMQHFYKDHGPANRFKSHSTCLCCVANIPTSPLPCGHVLCHKCVQVFGKEIGNGLLEMRCCPLHPPETDWTEPVTIKFKPQEAGVRVLCLDGGGVRSIAQVTMLQAIEKALGGNIPIQRFFDLIVGAGTGGIIALGLGVENWRTFNCVGNLKTLLDSAFKHPRMMAGLDQKGYYRAGPVRSALSELYHKNARLYGDFTPQGLGTRVAITSTLAGQRQPAVLSNYNREAELGLAIPYKFVRAHDSTAELRILDVARAAVAATPYFRPFVHEDTMTAYADRGNHRVSPAVAASHELRCLWGDEVCPLPDILLSLGTGLSSGAKAQARVSNRSPGHEFGLGRLMGDTARVDDELKHEEDWKEYRDKDYTKDDKYTRATGYSRNERLNVHFPGKRPQFDVVRDLDSIETLAWSDIGENSSITRIAQRLLASCFYFETYPNIIPRTGAGKHECFGQIRCRFDDGSDDLKGLGLSLRHYIDGTGVPFFYIQENFTLISQRSRRVDLPKQTIKDMCESGIFKLPTDLQISAQHLFSETNIFLCFKSDDSRYDTGSMDQSAESLALISGFPRKLFTWQRTVQMKPNPVSVDLASPGSPLTQTHSRASSASHNGTRGPSFEESSPIDTGKRGNIEDGRSEPPTLPPPPPPLPPLSFAAPISSEQSRSSSSKLTQLLEQPGSPPPPVSPPPPPLLPLRPSLPNKVPPVASQDHGTREGKYGDVVSQLGQALVGKKRVAE